MRPVSLVLLAAVLAADAAAMNVIGSAYGVDDGELRYREIHQCSSDGDRCTVEYKNPAGEVFARKVVNYQDSLQAPSLEMQDLRHGETVRIKGDDGGELVIDAGFDHYVRRRWQQLVDGDTVRFPFLVAGRDKPLDMTARKAVGDDCPQGRMCFTVALDNWLLSRLVSPIWLEYDARDRRLLQFRGVSNIRDAEGRSQQVRIDYRYPEASPEGSTS
ncbi:hypothetical protein DWB85_07400 [Seongchinamella sediminis]|uniref:Uncharacterized protein n=1 Tax=Seongchinamella sediminis TaxID=2283635 RepID=A0A3L7DYZ5_9GAMM|nr:hypothetical protein [Seongchinamella sediminis]RLQ22436.1 hypothetical protein DWB85_07400 [Seongchinamella sediminis]